MLYHLIWMTHDMYLDYTNNNDLLVSLLTFFPFINKSCFDLFQSTHKIWLNLLIAVREKTNVISSIKFISISNIYSNDMPEHAEVSRVVDTLLNNPGFGTRCMHGDPIP